MTSKFEQNIAVLELFDPQLARQLADIPLDPSWIVKTATGLDIEIDGSSYYSPDIVSCSRVQLKKYLDTGGVRIFGGWPTGPTDTTTVASKFWAMGNAQLKESQQHQHEIEGGGCLLVLGLGAGVFLQTLLEEINVIHVFIVERDIRVLRCAFEFMDLLEIVTKIRQKGGKILFFTGGTPQKAAAQLIRRMTVMCNGMMDGAYVYEHCPDEYCTEVANRVQNSLNLFFQTMGFFEDECLMMRSFLSTMYHAPGRLLSAAGRKNAVNLPAFVVGSGPSLDEAIPYLKKNSDRATIFSCGTALTALLKQGVVPDFHLEIENTIFTEQIIEELSDAYDLSNIIFVASNTVPAKAAACFKTRIYYFRDSISSSRLFSGPYGVLDCSSPTVTNSGARTAIAMGFKKLFFFGVDLGARDMDYHHSKSSIYYFQKERWDSYASIKSANSYTTKREGNFGGEVWTNSNLTDSAASFAYLFSMIPCVSVFNCSDGLKIDGTVPCRLEELANTIDDVGLNGTKAVEHKAIVESIDEFDLLDLAPMDRIDLLGEASRELGENIKHAFGQAMRGQIGLWSLHVELYLLLRETISVEDKTDEQIAVLHAARSIFSGSTFMIFSFLHMSLRRLTESDRQREQPKLFALAQASIDEMLLGVSELITELKRDFA